MPHAATSATVFVELKPNHRRAKSAMTGAMCSWAHRPLAAAFSSLFVASLALAGCAGGRAAAGAQSPAPGSSAVPGAAPDQVPAGQSAASPTQPGVASAAHAPVPRLPEIVLDPKQAMRSLPELKVENIGLHIGGGPNDAETKAPFLSAVAERFPAFMDCYRKNEEPAPGGRFGVDLHIARAGGHPRLEQPRTSLHGPDFRSCLTSVFESVEFQKPKRGPTTISYSLRFTLVEAP